MIVVEVLEIMNQLHDIDPRIVLVPEGDRDTFQKLEEQARSVLCQIAELQAAVAKIRVRQNSFLPALRAPDDILVTIFLNAVDIEDAISYTRDLLILTSVCSRWRAVATAFPSLWTSIRLDKPELTSLFLARSKSAPLSIGTLQHDVPLSYPEQLTALVGPRMDRIRSLAIKMNTPELYEAWVDHLATLPAPALQKLSLTMNSETRIAVGSPIFANETPSLRSLTLRRIVYPPTSPMFSNLRHLSLLGVFVPGGYQLRPLLEILSRTSALETLCLDCVHPLGGQYRGPAPGVARVPLARLRSFRMAALHPSALRVIPHLAVSEDTTFNIAMNFPMFPTEDVPILDHPLVLKGVVSARLATDRERPHSSASLVLSLYREEHPAKLSQPTLLLRAQTNVLQLYTAMVALDLRSVVRFEVDVTNLGEEADEVFWHRVLKRMPALRRLYILQNAYMAEGCLTASPRFDKLQGAYIERCLTALTPHEVHNDEDQALPCICPALEHLELRHVGHYRLLCFWGALSSIAGERRNVGLPLKSISLSILPGGSIPPILTALRARVGTVTVHRL